MESNGALDHVRPGDPWSAAGGLTDALHPESASCTSKEKIGGPQERPILQSQRRCSITYDINAKLIFIILWLYTAFISSLNQGRELSAGMMHVPLGFIITGGVKGIATSESTVDGERYGIESELEIEF